MRSSARYRNDSFSSRRDGESRPFHRIINFGVQDTAEAFRPVPESCRLEDSEERGMVHGAPTSPGEGYSATMGFVYIFNLVVGFGALTLPSVFYNSGYVLGSVFLAVLGAISFVTATFVVEAMASANAIKFLRLSKRNEYESVPSSDKDENARISPVLEVAGSDAKRTNKKRARLNSEREVPSSVSPSESSFEQKLKMQPFEMRDCLELGDMAAALIGTRGHKLLIAVTALYLYGDLAIYASATPTTLVALFPGRREEFQFFFQDAPVRIENEIAYTMWLLLFSFVVVPLSCLNFQKTKHLQIFTCTYRNLALLSMIILASVRYYRHTMRMHETDPSERQNTIELDLPKINVLGLPKLFGAATYSFMCHHSLPSIIFPIEVPSRHMAVKMLAVDYLAIFLTYMILCVTAFLAFETWKDKTCDQSPSEATCSIKSIYILNFSSGTNPFFGDLLALLPAFICFTNYPLIAITTRSNLCVWFDYFADHFCHLIGKRAVSDSNIGQEMQEISSISSMSEDDHNEEENKKRKGAPVRGAKIWHSLLVAVPPILVAFIVHDVGAIVEFTGSYAGLALEFLFPCWLVVKARARVAGLLEANSQLKNPFQSPFQSQKWIWAVLAWSAASLSFIFSQQISSLHASNTKATITP